MIKMLSAAEFENASWRNRAEPVAIWKARKYIEEHSSEELSLKKVAKAVNSWSQKPVGHCAVGRRHAERRRRGGSNPRCTRNGCAQHTSNLGTTRFQYCETVRPPRIAKSPSAAQQSHSKSN